MGRFMSPRGTQAGLGGFETAGTAIVTGNTLCGAQL